MAPAYSKSNDENTSTVTPSDSMDSDGTFSPCNEDKSNAFESRRVQGNKNGDNEKLYYSTSEMQWRRKGKTSELKNFSTFEPL